MGKGTFVLLCLPLLTHVLKVSGDLQNGDNSIRESLGAHANPQQQNSSSASNNSHWDLALHDEGFARQNNDSYMSGVAFWAKSSFQNGTAWLLLAFAIASLIIVLSACCVLAPNAPPCGKKVRYPVPSNGVYDWKQCALAATISFVVGWTDTVTFIRYEGFAFTMTGNLFKFGYMLVHSPTEGEDSPLLFLLIVVAYMFGVVLYRSLQLKCGEKGIAIWLGPILVFFVALFDIADWVWIAHGPEDSPVSDKWVLIVIAPACGVMNAMVTKGGLTLNLNTLTGHLLAIAYKLAELGRGTFSRANPKIDTLAMQGVAIVSLIGGAFSSAVWPLLFLVASGEELVHSDFKLTTALLPVVPLFLVIFVMHDLMFFRCLPSECDEKDHEEDLEMGNASEEQHGSQGQVENEVQDARLRRAASV